jgi:hypothetical protein
MKNKLFLWGGFLVFTLLLLNTIALYKSFRKGSTTNSLLITHSDTLVLSKTIEKSGAINNYTITKIYPPDIPPIVDTVTVINDYYSKHVFSSTFSDSVITLQKSDTVSQNKILGSFFTYKLTTKEKIITNTVIAPFKKQLYGGAAISVRTVPKDTLFLGIAPVIGMSFRKFNIDARYEFPLKRASITLVRKF